MDISLDDLAMEPIGPAQKRLAELFRGATVSSRIAFLLCLLVQKSIVLKFPSESAAMLLLYTLDLFERAFVQCTHCRGELVCLHPSLLGRLCRSTSTAIPSVSCITLHLYLAVTCPASVALGHRIVGNIHDSCLVVSPLVDERSVGVYASLSNTKTRMPCSRYGQWLLCLCR